MNIDSQPLVDLPAVLPANPESESVPIQSIQTPEINGRNGLDPTRYGDWENQGRCIDF
ncbi:MAG: DUF1674 domain-containing protein [Methylomonas sp.]